MSNDQAQTPTEGFDKNERNKSKLKMKTTTMKKATTRATTGMG